MVVVGLAVWVGGFNGAARALEAPKLVAQREQVRNLLAEGQRAVAERVCDGVLADPQATSGDRLWATLWAAELASEAGRAGSALDRLVAGSREDAVAASLLDLATLKAIDSARRRAPKSLTVPEPGSPPSTWPAFALEDLANRLVRDIEVRWSQLAGTEVEVVAPFATTTIPTADAPTFLDQYLLGLLEIVRLGDVEAGDLLRDAPAAEAEGARRLVRRIRDRAAELDRTDQARAGVALRLAVADRVLRWRHDVGEPELQGWVQGVEADPSVAPELRARAALILWGKLPWQEKEKPKRRAWLEAHLGAPGVDGEMVWDALNPPSSRTIGLGAEGIVPPGRPLEVTVLGAPSIELEARWLEGQTAPPQRSVVREVSPGKVPLDLAPGKWELTARHPGRTDAASDAMVHVWVSSIGAEIREARDGWDVFVYSTRDGSPLDGAEVEGQVCAPGPRKPPDIHGNPRAVTNAAGLGHVSTTSCRLPREPSWDWNGEQPVVFRVRHDGSELTLQLVRPRAIAPTGSRQKLVVYPDHWLYEPGDTVRALVLALEDDGSGDWRALANQELEVKLERGEEVLAGARAQSDSRGRAEIDVPLAEDVVLGAAWLRVSVGADDTRAVASLQIDRPRRPTIEILGDRPVEVGDVVRISGRARSLVGASLAGAQVEVRASDRVVGAPAEKLLAETIVGEQGEWAVKIPRPKEHWGAQVLVTAADGETSMTRVGGGSPGFRHVAVDTEDLVGWAGQARKVRIHATGFGFGVHGWILERVEPRPGSASRGYPGVWRSWPSDTRFEKPVTIARGEVVLGGPSWWSNPEDEVELPPLAAGTYRLRLEGSGDHDGGLFAVVSSKPVRDLQLPSELLVWIDEEAAVGAELVVGIWCAPSFRSAAIETIIDELQVDRAGEVPCGVAQRFAIPVRAVHRRHGLVARVLAVHDGALVSQVVRFDPSRFDRTLGIDLQSRSAGPGNVAIEAGVRDLAEARPVAADVLAVARDRAHRLLGDSFGWWELARGSEALWKLPELRLPYRVATAGRVSGHGVAPPPRATPPRVLALASPHRTWQQPAVERLPIQVVGVEPPPVHNESIVYTEDPGGLSEPPAHLAELGPRAEPRGEAPKVALWLPNLRTDADGRVEIPFPLPNALGEWEVEVHALSDDFAVGWAHTVVATRRPLQVRWIAPRVVRRGDRVVAHVAVDNRSAEPALAEVALEPADLPGVRTVGWPEQVRVEPGATVLLPVELQPQAGTELLELVVRGRAGNHADAERVRIVVEPAAAHLAVGDAAVLGGGDEVALVAGFGGNDPGLADDRRLEVKVWGDAAAAIDDALRGVAASSAKCLDERVRRAVALARLGQGSFGQATIDEVVAELAEHQAPGGALPWLPGGPPSLAATLHILEDLAELEAVKPEVVQAIAGRALPWVMAELERNAAAKPPNLRVWVQGLVTLAAWPASSSTAGSIDLERREALWKGFKRHHRHLSRYGRARLATAAIRDGRPALAEDLLEELVAQLGREQALVSFRGGPRDWRSAAAEPEALLTAAALLGALIETGWPDAQVADDVSGWILRDLAANGPRCSSLELLTAGRALARHRAARGLSGIDGVVWARVGEERREAAVGRSASSIEWKGAEVAGDMRDLTAGMIGPEAARAVVGARLEWVSEVLPQSELGGALRVERRVLVRDPGSRSGWREVIEGEVMAPGEELAVELVIESALPLHAVRLIDPRPAGFEPVDEASGSVWVDGRHAWRQVHPAGLELWIERLPAGRMVFTHVLRARFGGDFRIPPARIEAFYTPMLAGTSSGARVGVQHFEMD